MSCTAAAPPEPVYRERELGGGGLRILSGMVFGEYEFERKALLQHLYIYIYIYMRKPIYTCYIYIHEPIYTCYI
jgi:hypothetical protein